MMSYSETTWLSVECRSIHLVRFVCPGRSSFQKRFLSLSQPLALYFLEIYSFQ